MNSQSAVWVSIFTAASLVMLTLGFKSRTASTGVFRTIKKFKGYKSVSVPPGEMPKESQSSINPIDTQSTVLVIGASRGIGLEFVEQLLKKGASVIATYRGKSVPRSLNTLSCEKLTFLEMDAGDEASTKEAAIVLKRKLGTNTLTHVIHNAGIIGLRQGFGEVDASDMIECYRVNAVGPLLTAQSFSPLFRKTSEERPPVFAILTSKVGSIDDNGSGGIYAYRSSKAACNQVAKSLSIDLHEEGIKCVLLHPGYVRTDMTRGNGLIDKPESVAGLIKAIENTGMGTPFRFVDFKADQIPW